MKEKTNEPKPVVKLKYGKNESIKLFVLDEGDSMAWNSSTNYDYHMPGPSLVYRHEHPNGNTTNEHYVNDPDQWRWIERMMRLGKKYLDENPDFDIQAFDKELRDERAEYKPHVSFHKNKAN